MDLAYLRAHPGHIGTFLHHQRLRVTPVPGGSICTANRLTLDDGTDVFAKSWPEGAAGPPPGFFAAEAAGLRWLRAADAVPVPEVLAETDTMLVLEWVQPGPVTPAGAERFGRQLAALHAAGAPRYGADRDGYIGSLPLDNAPLNRPDEPDSAWPGWFAERRLQPYLRRSVDNGALGQADARAVQDVIDGIGELAGPSEPPSRLHGDLWPGNVLWDSTGTGWLVDPAAHGGHRETDLALLALFGGVPMLDRILRAYQEVSPLADGWRERVPLHQLHLLLVHTALFGSSYASAVRQAADTYR